MLKTVSVSFHKECKTFRVPFKDVPDDCFIAIIVLLHIYRTCFLLIYYHIAPKCHRIEGKSEKKVFKTKEPRYIS